jgi:ethanolamine utilization protein EutN
MQLAKVIGTVVSTQKNRKLEGAKLLLVQPMTPAGEPRGT